MTAYDEYLDTIGRLYPDKLMEILEQNDQDELALACFNTCLGIEESEYKARKLDRVMDLFGIVTLLTLIITIIGVC